MLKKTKMEYIDWQTNVFKGLSKNLGTTNFEIGMLIKAYNNKNGEDVLDTLFSSGASCEAAIQKLMVLNPKFQVRGTFTVKSKSGITETVLAFCFDIDISYYEGVHLLGKGRNDITDINLCEFVTNTIDKDDIGVNKEDIVIISMELWCNRFNKGWFLIK